MQMGRGVLDAASSRRAHRADLDAARDALLGEDDDTTAFDEGDPRVVAARRAAGASKTPVIRRLASRTGGKSFIAKTWQKQVEAFEVKALAVSGRLMGAEQIDVLASLPTRDQAISMLMSVMQAPVAKLARTLNEVPGKLVRTLAAVRDQKEAA